MPRTSIPVEGMLGSLSLNREVEFMVQMLGWSESQIVSAVLSAHPELKSDQQSLINHIRVCRSRYRTDQKENAEVSALIGGGTVTSLDKIADKKLVRFACGIDHIDMLWGFSEDGKIKGFPRGQISLIAGSPGVGKTRAMIAVCGKISAPDYRPALKALYWQNEFALEQFKTVSKSQIKSGARFRCGDIRSLKEQLKVVDKEKPDLVVVDSIQMLEEAKNKTGMERCIAAYKAAAVEHNIHVVLVGQLNKREQVAGSRVLEHLVDSVFTAVRDRDTGGFAIRCTKNRWGMSGIQGCFKHTATGIEPVGDITQSED
jgi:DNA repair protein RadA/Sms